jgi:hypothetical protein
MRERGDEREQTDTAAHPGALQVLIDTRIREAKKSGEI